MFRGKKTQPILVQVARQVVKLNPADLRLPSRAWKVKLLGEGADDAGGVFDDTITEMCQVRPLPLTKHTFCMTLLKELLTSLNAECKMIILRSEL